jgi:dolichol kinase
MFKDEAESFRRQLHFKETFLFFEFNKGHELQIKVMKIIIICITLITIITTSIY